MTDSIFSQFTRRYQISKTLRFELKPIGKTAELLKNNKVFEKDKTIDESYHQAKFYFDMLHRRFIDSALKSDNIKNINFEGFAKNFEEINKNLTNSRKQISELKKNKRNNNKEIEDLDKEIRQLEDKIISERKKLYKEICEVFNKEAELWKEKYKGKKLDNEETIHFNKTDLMQKGTDFLTSAGSLKILKYEFPKSKEEEFKKLGWPSLYVEQKENSGIKRYIFNSFDGFTGYLTDFQRARKNLYLDDGSSTAVATRIVSNFEIFLANKKIFFDRYSSIYKDISFSDTYIFETSYYKSCLLQKDIEDLDNKDNNKSYNKIIGRFNQQIKEYKDKIIKDKDSKKNNYPLLKKLEKQILGEVRKEKQLIEETGDKDKDNKIFLDVFKKFIEINEERFSKAKSFMTKFFNNEFETSYEGVYIKNTTINTISRRWFSEGYGREFELLLPQKSKRKEEVNEPKVKQSITLSDIKNAVESLEGKIFKEEYYNKKVINENDNLWKQFLDIWKFEFNNLFIGVKKEDGSIVFEGYIQSLEKATSLNSFLREKNEQITIVKNYSDTSLKIFQLMKYLDLDKKSFSKIPGQKDTNFYSELDEYAENFEFIKYYNAIRNFITKKPFSNKMIRLNFENGKLLEGWDENKEYDYMGILLLRENKYYLGIMNKNNRNLFLQIDSFITNENNGYRKLVYKQIADASKDLPRLLLTSRTAKNYFKPSDEILRIKREETFKRQNKNFNLQDLHKLIDYYKRCIYKYPNWKFYNFKFRETNKYQNIKEFIDDVQHSGYKISFVNIKEDYINMLINEGKLYFFEITNKDISNTKNGKKSLHTLYFEHIFSEKKLDDNMVLKLSGKAKIFQREKSINNKEKIITQKNKQILEKGNRAFKLRRYTESKIMIHISIILNADKNDQLKENFNVKINKHLSDNISNVNILGIDRGEKNLIYYSVINQKGEILEQGSLNKINGVDYYQKLIEREKERLIERQSWEQIAKIKDLKKGYLSQVIKKIADLVIKYNAIIVMENLNMRFKQIRGGIERSVYQQLEKQLIDKLSYLVFKDRQPNEAGGILNGYQLVAPFTSFEKIGNQTGIIFYTQADYTSVTDPLTGFRKNIYISNSSPRKKIKDLINKIKFIGWDDLEKSYFFTYNPVDFVDEKNKDNVYSKDWTIYAKVPRIRRYKDINGYWNYESFDVNEGFKKLFELWSFKNLYNKDIKTEIIKKEREVSLIEKRNFYGKEKDFYESFIYLFNLILQLRNSFSIQIKIKDGKVESIDEGIDFIASPVKPFFTTGSKKGEKTYSHANFSKFERMIISEKKNQIINDFNADSNGAYNIARKGIIILNRIKNNPERSDFYISKYDWDKEVINWGKHILTI